MSNELKQLPLWTHTTNLHLLQFNCHHDACFFLQELLASAPVWDNNQGNCNLDHSYQPMSVRQETVDQAKKQPGLGWSCQNLLDTKASQVESKQESPIRDTSRSLQTVIHSPGQLKKARNPKSSKVQLVGAMQDNDCKTISSKKRSACK